MSAIFLDRDGVIIRKAPEGEYVADWAQVEFLPGSLNAIAAIHRFGYKVIVVTNQRGVATGKIQLTKMMEIHTRMRQVVAASGGNIMAVYYCPHDISEDCTCRKPNPGMLLQAAAEHNVELHKCWMVGDAATDIVAGKSVGCKTALIAHSEGLLQCKENPDIWAENLAAAVERILSDERGMDKPQMNEIHRNGPASHQFLVKEKAKVTRAKPD